MYRRSFADDPQLCDRVFELLGTWLPVLPVMRKRAEALGGWRWEDTSTPFVYEQEGRVVSHLGVLEMDWVCDGRELRVGGIHAVCTLAGMRRQGLYRALMEEALDWCDQRYETLELTTEHPEYYEPFGFRHVPEHRFRMAIEGSGDGTAFRRLQLEDAADLARLDELLARRTPLSSRLAPLRDRAVFKFNLGGGAAVDYCEALDLAAVWERDADGCLQVYDLVAESLPSFSEIRERLAGPVHGVRFHFDPAALGVDAAPEPVRDDWLMIRGPLPLPEDGVTGMLSPMARH